MKRLLLPLLAALALPTAVNAESYWLVIGWSVNSNGMALEKIEMGSMEQCKEQGESYRKEKGPGFVRGLAYKCLKGK